MGGGRGKPQTHASVKHHRLHPGPGIGLTLTRLDELQCSANRWLQEHLRLTHVSKSHRDNMKRLLNLSPVPDAQLHTQHLEKLRVRLAESLQNRHDLRDNSGFKVGPLGPSLENLVGQRRTQRISLLNMQSQAIQDRWNIRGRPSPLPS